MSPQVRRESDLIPSGEEVSAFETCVHGYLAMTCAKCRKGEAGGASFRSRDSSPAPTQPSDTISLKHDVIDKVTERFARDARRQGPKPTYPAPTEE